jgi:hypothetical protein
MPKISLLAAVRDRVGRAIGSTPTNGLQLGQQLDAATEQFATQLTRRGIDQKICKQSLYLRRMSGHRAAQASSNQRLRGAMLWSRRYGRLRAHFQLLTQMPIAAPVNVSGAHWQVSRNNLNTNSGIGRTDGLRTLLRRTACKVRWNVAFSYTKGTVHHCLLGNILVTESVPREVTGHRRRLAMCGSSSEMGHPQKNNLNQKKLLVQTRMATDSRGRQHVRRLSWHQERLHHVSTARIKVLGATQRSYFLGTSSLHSSVRWGAHRLPWLTGAQQS